MPGDIFMLQAEPWLMMVMGIIGLIVTFAFTVTERPCEHAEISDRTSVHLSGLTFTCRGGAAPGRHVTVTIMKCVGSR